MNRKRGVHRNRGISRWLSTLLIVAVLAIAVGYVATKYIISPYLLGQQEQNQQEGTKDNDESFHGSGIIIDDQEYQQGNPDEMTTSDPDTSGSEETALSSGIMKLYCIQYGSFSTKEGAEQTVNILNSSSVDAAIIENDGSYKVIGTPFVNEKKAREALETMKPIAGEDIFITTMEARMK